MRVPAAQELDVLWGIPAVPDVREEGGMIEFIVITTTIIVVLALLTRGRSAVDHAIGLDSWTNAWIGRMGDGDDESIHNDGNIHNREDPR